MGFCTPVSYVLLFVGGACFAYALFASLTIYMLEVPSILTGPKGPEEFDTSVLFGDEELDLYYPKSVGDCDKVFNELSVKWNCTVNPLDFLGVSCQGDDETTFAKDVVVTKDCSTTVPMFDADAVDPDAPNIEMLLVGKFNAYTVERQGTNGTYSATVGTYWITSPNQPLHYQWQFAQNANDALGVLAMIIKFVLIALSTCIWWCGACVFCSCSGYVWSRSSAPASETNPGAVEMYQS